MDDKDLASILKRCLANGTKADWECFVELAQPVLAAGVLRSLSRLTPATRELVDDLIQETFLKICAANFRVLRNFRTDDSNALRVYLRTIAASTVTDHFRSQSALKKGAGKKMASLDDVAPQLAADDRQFAELERRDIFERVEKCLDTQEPRNRTIFWLYHRQGFTPKAISALAGIGLSPDGIETTIYRLTKGVRECLRRAGLFKTAAIHEGDRA
jgi:RNA polymerase sigma-70 factor, ECF subfamily